MGIRQIPGSRAGRADPFLYASCQHDREKKIKRNPASPHVGSLVSRQLLSCGVVGGDHRTPLDGPQRGRTEDPRKSNQSSGEGLQHGDRRARAWWTIRGRRGIGRCYGEGGTPWRRGSCSSLNRLRKARGDEADEVEPAKGTPPPLQLGETLETKGVTAWRVHHYFLNA